MPETHVSMVHYPYFELRSQPITTVPSHSIAITYTNLEVSFYHWMREHVPVDVVPLDAVHSVGFDAETQPVYRAGQTGRLGQLQFAVEGAALVFHIDGIIPAPHGPAVGAVRHFFSRTDIELVGMGIKEDMARVRGAVWACDEYDDGRGPAVVELKRFGELRGVSISGGLGPLTEFLCGAAKWKSKKLQMSNWISRPLSTDQIRYASMDAWAGCACYFHLKTMPLLMPRLAPEEFISRFAASFQPAQWISERTLSPVIPRAEWPSDSLADTARDAGLEWSATSTGKILIRIAPLAPS